MFILVVMFHAKIPRPNDRTLAELAILTRTEAHLLGNDISHHLACASTNVE